MALVFDTNSLERCFTEFSLLPKLDGLNIAAIKKIVESPNFQRTPVITNALAKLMTIPLVEGFTGTEMIEAVFSEVQVQKLNTEEVQLLDCDQISMLLPKGLDVSKLSTKQIEALTDMQIQSLPNSQVTPLLSRSPAVASKLSEPQVTSLLGEGVIINNLTDSQVDALTETQLKNMSQSQINSILALKLSAPVKDKLIDKLISIERYGPLQRIAVPVSGLVKLNLAYSSATMQLPEPNFRPTNIAESQIASNAHIFLDLNHHQGSITDDKGNNGNYVMNDLLGTDTKILTININRFNSIYLFDKKNNSLILLSNIYLDGEKTYDIADQQAWVSLVKLLNSPWSIAEVDVSNITNTIINNNTNWGLRSRDFKASILPIIVHQVLQSLATIPANVNNSNLLLVLNNVSSVYQNTYSKMQQEIAILISKHWNRYSVEVQANILRNINSGNTASMNIYADLLINYLDDNKDNPSPTLYPDLSNILKNVILNPNIDIQKKDQIIQKILDCTISNLVCKDSKNPFIDFVYEILFAGNKIVLDLDQYQAKIEQGFTAILNASGQDFIRDSLNKMLLVIASYQTIGNEFRVAFNRHVNFVLDKYVSYPPSYIHIMYAFINALAGPLTDKTRLRIEGYFNSAEVYSFSHIGYNILRNSMLTNGVLTMPPSIVSNLFNIYSQYLIDNFDPKQNNVFGSYGIILGQLIVWMKKSEKFSEYSKYLLPLLEKYNPRQGSEDADAYQIRLTKVKNLFQQNGVFLADLTGGVYKTQGYLDTIADFKKHHPDDWLDVIILDNESATAQASEGISRFSLTRLTTPLLLADAMLHEGPHAYELKRNENTTLSQATDVLIDYWFRADQWARQSYPTSYSAKDRYEYFAEYARSWDQDSSAWLKLAIQNNTDGHPAMLNMFMFIWNMFQDPNAPAGQMPLHKLKDDGLLDVEYIDAKWLRGNMYDGEFQFTFENVQYNLVYKNYKIQACVPSAVKAG